MVLLCEFYTNPSEMKILKELDCQTLKERFKTEKDCYNYLAEIKRENGYSC